MPRYVPVWSNGSPRNPWRILDTQTGDSVRQPPADGMHRALMFSSPGRAFTKVAQLEKALPYAQTWAALRETLAEVIG